MLCHAAQVSQQELASKRDSKQPTWPQMWRLLQQLAAQQQHGEVPSPSAVDDAAMQFDKFLREAEGVPLTPPPYPGVLVLQVQCQDTHYHSQNTQGCLPNVAFNHQARRHRINGGCMLTER